MGLELPWLLPGCAASPFLRKAAWGALEPAVPWAGQVSKVVTLVIGFGSLRMSGKNVQVCEEACQFEGKRDVPDSGKCMLRTAKRI